MITMDAPASSAASVYTDLGRLARLREQASQDGRAALPEVAQQFEAMFLQMLLKSMRQTTLGDPLVADQGGDLYRGLFDHQIALSLARARGIGLADLWCKRSVGQRISPRNDRSGSSPPGGQVSPLGACPKRARPRSRRSPPGSFRTRFRDAGKLRAEPTATCAARGTSPRVAPEVLIAQTALETGWGRAMIRHPNGENSFNLFGIKANEEWQGSRVTVPTIEFVDGVMERRQSAFRAYPSASESFEDYVDLIRDSSRYQSARANASDPAAYVHGLQRRDTRPIRTMQKVLTVIE